MRLNAELGPDNDLNSLSPAAFAGRSAIALESALDPFTAGQREVVVRLGTWSEDHEAQAFAWSIALKHLAHLPPERLPLSLRARYRVISDWANGAKLDPPDDEIVDQGEVLSNTSEAMRTTLNDLVRQSQFDAIWEQIQHWPEEERRTLIQLATAEAMPLGIADKLVPEV
jgi:hypothetical protein